MPRVALNYIYMAHRQKIEYNGWLRISRSRQPQVTVEKGDWSRGPSFTYSRIQPWLMERNSLPEQAEEAEQRKARIFHNPSYTLNLTMSILQFLFAFLLSSMLDLILAAKPPVQFIPY